MDDKILALTTIMSKLEKNKTYVLETVQGGGGNRTNARTNNKVRYPNRSYVKGIHKL